MIVNQDTGNKESVPVASRMDFTTLLPGEILNMVFHYLEPKDRKVVVLVCHRWKDEGEDPRLWTWVRITVTSANISVIPAVLGWRRLQAVRRIVMRAVLEFSKDESKCIISENC